MSTQVIDLWDRACIRLQDKLRPDVYSRWIAVINPVSFEDHKLILGVDNDFYQSWLEENYIPLIREAVRDVAQADVSISLKVQPGSSKLSGAAIEQELPLGVDFTTDSKSKKGSRTVADRLVRKPGKLDQPKLNPRFTFDGFIIGSSNTFANAAALAVAQAPGRAYNPLFVYGDSGLGKTHLMQAIGHQVLESSNSNVCYVSSETLLNEYVESIRNRSTIQFRKKYRSADLLLIDDIHFLAGKESMQEEFFHTFNTLYDSNKQIVMTSDRPAREITGLEQRLVSRFEWGLVTEVEAPDLETRVAILKHKQRNAQVKLADDILFFIAENVRTNIRSLEGALTKTISFSALMGQSVTVDALSTILRDTIEKERQSDLSFDTIQRTVAEYYDIRLADMSSMKRPRSIAVPRQVAMYLCRRLTKSSLPDIAGAFAKNHATVLHAYRTIDKRMDVDSSLKQDVVTIAGKLGKKFG